MTRDEEKIRGVRRERDLDARSIRLAFSDVSRAVTPDTPTLAAVAHGTPKARWSQAQQVAHVQSSGAASRTARRGHQLDIVAHHGGNSAAAQQAAVTSCGTTRQVQPWRKGQREDEQEGDAHSTSKAHGLANRLDA